MSSGFKRITPECENMGNFIAIMGALLIAVMVIMFIVTIVTVLVNYLYKPTDVTNKNKYMNYLQLAAAVLSFVGMMLGAWNVMVSSKLKKCIKNAPG